MNIGKSIQLLIIGLHPPTYFLSLPFSSRDELAGCSEKAYDHLSLADAKEILMFSSDQELATYTAEVIKFQICVYLTSIYITTNPKIIDFLFQCLGAARVGDQKWLCVLPEGQGLRYVQGDSISSAHQPDPELRQRVGKDRLVILILSSSISFEFHGLVFTDRSCLTLMVQVGLISPPF